MSHANCPAGLHIYLYLLTHLPAFRGLFDGLLRSRFDSMLDGPLRLYSAFYVRASCARAPPAPRAAQPQIRLASSRHPYGQPLWVAHMGSGLES